MIEQQLETCGLPAHYYTDPAYFDQEMQAHFVNGWCSLGVASMVPNDGDVYTVKVAGQPLLVTRDREGEVRVFRNVCRHRGTQLVTEACNRNELITCPYHAWSYRLNGKLAAAPKCGVDEAARGK